MRRGCARKPVVRKLVLQQVEIRKALDDDGHVRIVGHTVRPDIEEKFGDQRSHDSKRDPNSRSPHSRSNTTGTKMGSMRGIVENPGQEKLGCLQRLAGTSVSQLGIGQQTRSDGKVIVGLTGYRQGARWLDDQ